MALQDEMRRAYIAKADENELDGDPLDLRAELSIQRDLLYIFLGRQAHSLGIELPGLPVGTDGATALIDMAQAETLSMVDAIEVIYNMVNDITKVTSAIVDHRKGAMMTALEFEREALRLEQAIESTFVKFIKDPHERQEAVKYFAERTHRPELTK